MRAAGKGAGKGRPLAIDGMRFGHLVVVRRVGSNAFGKVVWECSCDCGRRKAIIGSFLKNGHTTSCGCRMGFKGRPLADFFWRHVNKTDGCWLWTAHRNRKGYAVMTAKGHPELSAINPGKRTWLASRVSWVLAHGSIPDDKFACHHCDNPLCVRPDHLFLGTQQDNVDDMIRKGRGAWQR